MAKKTSKKRKNPTKGSKKSSTKGSATSSEKPSKKKHGKKQQKKQPSVDKTPRAKLAKRVERFAEANDVTYDQLAMAGLGFLATKLPGKKQKKAERTTKRVAGEFRDLVRWGERIAPEVESDSAVDEPETVAEVDDVATDAPEPVISYQPRDEDWYAIEIDGVHVDLVQGEQAAAQLAGELLANYAALEPERQRESTTSIVHTGGGWYEVIVQGVPVDRVRGKQVVTDRFGHILDLLDEPAADAAPDGEPAATSDANQQV